MFRRFLPQVGWSLMLIGLLTGGWGWYVYAHRSRLDDENRRELGLASRELSRILSELGPAAETYIKGKGGDNGVDTAELREWVSRNPYLAPRVDVRPTHPCVANRPFEPALKDLRHLAINLGPQAVRLDVNPHAIFDDVAISPAFAYLFIAYGNGVVPFAIDHGPASQRRSERGWLERKADDDAAADHAIIAITNLSGLETTGGVKLDAKDLARAGQSRQVRLGEKVYRLYTYPFIVPQLADSCAVEETTWIVGGLMDPEQMSREALTIAPQWTFILLLCLVVALAGQPFVKLFVLGPTERFRFADACLLLPCATFLLLLATILLLDHGSYERLETLASGGIESLATEVERNLTSEIRTMRKQLVEYDNRLGAKDAICAAPGEDDTELLSERAGSTLGVPKHYADLEQVAWIGPSGGQFFKGTIHRNSRRVSVATRPYFTEPRQGNLWTLRDDPEDQRPFFAQSIRSMTTGDLFTAVSIRANCKIAGPGGALEPAVAAMSAQPVSITRPSLPLGYGFAIIDSGGRVLYHSDRRRALKENLFEEVADPERLYAAVQAGTQTHFGTTYSRRRAQLFVRPFAQIPSARWFLVTMRERHVLDAVNIHAMLRALMWSSIPLAVPFVLALILLALGPARVGPVWPNPSQAGLHRATALGYATALLAGLAGAMTLPGNGPLYWSLAFPLVLPVISLFVHFAWQRLHANRSFQAAENSSILGYRLAWAALWAAAAIVPATGIFRHSWRLELAKLDKFEQTRIARAKRDWSAQDAYHARNLAASDLQSWLAKRKTAVDSYHLAAFADPVVKTAFERITDRFLPLFSDSTAKLVYQGDRNGTARPQLFTPGGRFSPVRFLLAFIVLPFVAWKWLGFKINRLFWSELASKRTTTRAVDGRFSVVIEVPCVESAPPAAMMAAAGVSGGAPAPASAATRVEIPHLEFLMLDEKQRLEKLQQLERAVGSNNGTAIIHSHTDIFDLLEGRSSEIPLSLSEAEKERWIQVLEPFTHRIGTTPAAPSFEPVWRYLTQAEQLTLIHVVEEGFANPHQTAVVEQLLRKNLVKFDPQLKVTSPAFEAFVRTKASNPAVKTWEHPQGTMGWRGGRWVFTGALAVALVFLGGTQESWSKELALLLGALTAVLEGIPRLLDASKGAYRAVSE